MSHLYFLGVLGWKGFWDVYLMPVKRECYAWMTAPYICPRFCCEPSMLCICHFWPKLLKKGLPLFCTHNIMPHSTHLECRYLPDVLVLSCFSCLWLFVTRSTLGHQAILYSGFSRQENWSGLPCTSPADLPTQGSNLCLLSHRSPNTISLGLTLEAADWDGDDSWIKQQDKQKCKGKVGEWDIHNGN